MPLDLRDKVQKMPNIQTSIKKVTDKKGRNWFVVTTTISQFFSEKYMKIVSESKDAKDFKPREESMFG